ncbi:hypothetical protein FAVG1_10359 [Fusarium avenaceum]|nr:hypothetical protein FAVG1_10359 [Fusarium avenaceum]
MSPHKPSSSHTSKSPFWHGGIKSALSSAISIFQPSSSRPRPPAAAIQDQEKEYEHQTTTAEPQDPIPNELPIPIPNTLPLPPVPRPAHLPMANNRSSPTPGGDPTHSTYEVNVPVRNGRGSSPKVSNPEIRIPRITPVSDGTDQPQDQHQPHQGSKPQPQSHSQPQPQPSTSAPASTSKPSHQELAAGLDGKYVDEFGNILGWDGTVLGRVEGDLPSMVGRPVMPSGEILDEDGEVAGHVCDNYTKPDLKPLAGGLKVDDEGNIYNDQGNKIGKLDKPINDGPEKVSGSKDTGADTQGGSGKIAPKPPSAPRPDELFLDVKSTFDGIQLTIKIPTVFNRNVVTETKSSASQTDTTDTTDSSHNR